MSTRAPSPVAELTDVELTDVEVTEERVPVPGSDGDRTHEADELDDLLSVGVRARWTGADIAIGESRGDWRPPRRRWWRR